MPPDGDPFALARQGADALAAATGRPRHHAVLVLGTALGSVAGLLAERADRVGPTVDLAGLPGFVALRGPGHAAVGRSMTLGHTDLLVYCGRVHLYEGHGAHVVAHPVRAAVAAGCTTVLLTNAAGGIRPGLDPGAVVAIADHLNLTGTSPLTGVGSQHPVGSPFVELADCWSPRLRALAGAAAPGLPEGVYAHLPGPQFETPAEVRMLAALGADLVGMSTVPEAIAARHMGAEVLGLSVVVNPATGTPGWTGPTTASDIAAVAAGAVPAVADVVAGVVARLG